ncbi:ligand-dependent nuclear receptor corepressor-like protein isoform X4 [Osmerus eperlanus]|uniref:ligand-dependent nuclear receptor corepressor-like protein isoform X4 n=1 Tax=Osmerus eperlanus TaxID=29151 RepID=UPI002E14CA3E
MADVQCPNSKCTAERKGFRLKLDSWRHKLIHCVGFESILEGIYGPLLLKDISIFDDCEPEELDNWSMDASCSFCTLQLDKLGDHVPAATSPLSSPSDEMPSQAPSFMESNQSAHRFLYTVFHKKDVPQSSYDTNVPLVAKELMKKMIHQFALEYASKSPLYTTKNGYTTALLRPGPSDPDAPLDLTVSKYQENHGKEPQPEGVLDLSKRTSALSAPSSLPTNQNLSGRQRRQREEYPERSSELSEGLLSKALRDVRSGSLEEHRAALLYGIPPRTLRRSLEALAEGGLSLLCCLNPGKGTGRDEVTSQDVVSAIQGGEARLLLQRVAAWAEQAELGGEIVENQEISGVSSSASCLDPRSLLKVLGYSHPQLRDDLSSPTSPTPSSDPPTPLRIPQVRSSNPPRPSNLEPYSLAESLHLHTSPTEGTSIGTAARPTAVKLKPHLLLDVCLGGADMSPCRLAIRSSSVDDSEEGGDRRDKDKQPRKKRGRYRQYDHDLLEEAITMVMGGRMSVSKAQGVYGIPHSTLEYKVKERSGTLKIPPKRKPVTSRPTDPGTLAGSTNSGTSASAAVVKRF